ncbi:MAG TPA: hypothetical protein PLC17_00095 [Tenuifilaceae bacterium]|nr:hypothetical protein [Tenuifilaceae bacterium]
MKRFYLLFLAVSMIVAFSSCASKKYAKRGSKYEQAGMFEQAADMYYQSLVAKSSNIDARIGLQRNGERVLDDKGFRISQAYMDGDDKRTVLAYLDARDYRDKLSAVGVKLEIPSRAADQYNEVKPRYLEKTYGEAQLLLDEEKFAQAEEKFKEIKRIDPSYQSVDALMGVAKWEPVYREGKGYFERGLYRKSYYTFDKILKSQSAYKDAEVLKGEALEKGLLTLAITTFKNKTRSPEATGLLMGYVKKSLVDLKNPFVKVVDIQNADQFAEQQKRALEQGSSIKVGQLLAAKALLNGNITSFANQPGKLLRQEKTGYLKIVTKKKVPGSVEEKVEVTYKKVSYIEVKRANRVDCSFSYELTSTETGAILVSDAMNLMASDGVHYAEFDGDHKKLVPGYWVHIDKDDPKDKVYDNPNAVSELRALLDSKRTVKEVNVLKEEVALMVAERVSQAINNYNPEEQ